MKKRMRMRIRKPTTSKGRRTNFKKVRNPNSLTKWQMRPDYP
jgi:hypothetical protein